MTDQKPAVDTDKAKMEDLAEKEKKGAVVDQQTAASSKSGGESKD